MKIQVYKWLGPVFSPPSYGHETVSYFLHKSLVEINKSFSGHISPNSELVSAGLNGYRLRFSDNSTAKKIPDWGIKPDPSRSAHPPIVFETGASENMRDLRQDAWDCCEGPMIGCKSLF